MSYIKKVQDKPRLRDSTVVVVVVRKRPGAIPLAMITTRKSIHGFPLVSYMGMGLRLEALRAAEAPLWKPICFIHLRSFQDGKLDCSLVLYSSLTGGNICCRMLFHLQYILDPDRRGSLRSTHSECHEHHTSYRHQMMDNARQGKDWDLWKEIT